MEQRWDSIPDLHGSRKCGGLEGSLWVVLGKGLDRLEERGKGRQEAPWLPHPNTQWELQKCSEQGTSQG